MDYLNKINILYEDNHLLVVEKPINMPVQEDDSRDMDLLNLLKKYIKEKYKKEGNVYLGLVHRLDRPVGGVMVFAKTSKAASRLSEQLRIKQIKKEYLAVVDGIIKQDCGIMEDYLLKDNQKNIVYVDKKGKYSNLEFEVLQRKEGKTLVKINLITGRSHQIRVQFSSRGFPLLGDQKYNLKNKEKIPIALRAYKLSFYHPITKELMTFSMDKEDVYPFNIF